MTKRKGTLASRRKKGGSRNAKQASARDASTAAAAAAAVLATPQAPEPLLEPDPPVGAAVPKEPESLAVPQPVCRNAQEEKLDSNLFSDYEVSMSHHVATTCELDPKDPCRFCVGTPEELSRTMNRVWQVSPSPERIVQRY